MAIIKTIAIKRDKPQFQIDLEERARLFAIRFMASKKKQNKKAAVATTAIQ